jgi:hypothetical protein
MARAGYLLVRVSPDHKRTMHSRRFLLPEYLPQ